MGASPPEMSNPAASEGADEIHRFRTDPKCGVLLANPAAMGEGISLHDVCNDAIYLDRTFNAGHTCRALIESIGWVSGDITTTVTFLVTENTIDELVVESNLSP